MKGLTELPYWMAEHTPFWVKAVSTVIYVALVLAGYYTKNDWFFVAFGMLVIASFVEGAIRRARSHG